MTESRYWDGAVKNFGDQITENNPLISTVLIAHLKIEAEADRLISLISVKPEALESTRLSANQKFKLCEALWGNPDTDENFWEALEKLNILRNEIAHGLRHQELERKLRAFISTIADDEKGFEGQSLLDSLIICLCFLYHDMTELEKYCSRT